MNYSMKEPCDACPFRIGSGFTFASLKAHASGDFACHKTCTIDDHVDGEVFLPGPKSLHCAGALIFLEKQNKPHQMMRIAERLGLYDRTNLNMESPVVGCAADCKKPLLPAARRV